MSLLTPGWLKKALKLRAIVSCAPIQNLDDDDLERFDAMRAFRRGTIDLAELQRRTKPLPEKPIGLLHEPDKIYGWELKVSLYGRHGEPWWLVGVSRTSTPSAKDKAMLTKIMAALGCDDLERDAISVGDFDDVISEGIPYLYTWPNHSQLHEVQVNKAKTGKDMMRIVPRGSRANDGYEKVDMSGQNSES